MNWNEFIMKTYQIALPIVLGYVVWLLQEFRKDKKKSDEEQKQILDANSQGTKEILGYMIDRFYDEFVIQGYVTSEQFKRFEVVYQSYHRLKGNGTRTHKWEIVKEMEIRDTDCISPFAKRYFELLKANDKN